MSDRLPAPWTVHSNEDCFWVEDAEGKRLAYLYYREGRAGRSTGEQIRLTRDQARRVAANIAKLPDLLRR